MLARTSKVYWPGFLGASQSNFQRRHACQDNGAAAQARSGGGEHLVPGGVRDELVEGLADDRGRGATLRRCLDLGIPRVMSVLDPAIRISAAHPLVRGPGIESTRRKRGASTYYNRTGNGRECRNYETHSGGRRTGQNRKTTPERCAGSSSKRSSGAVSCARFRLTVEEAR
jgi:hypothetical protein